MDVVFTILNNGVERTLADWGVEEPQLSLVSRAMDVLSLSVVTDFDAPAQFAYRSALELYRIEGAERRRVFVGRVTAIPRAASNADERLHYEVSGLWWYLDNKVYQEFWAGAGAYKSRVQLSYGDDGEKISARDTLSKIFNYAIDAGAPFAIGDLTAIDGSIPSEEVGDRTCAEVIELVLRWYPDAVLWWDYSAPVPTVNISTAANVGIFDIAEDGEIIEDISYTPRADIRVPGVAIKYEWIDNVDGESIEVVTTDSAGDVDAFGAMVVTVSLRGGSVSTVRQRLVSDLIALESKTFWKKRVPQLRGVADADLTLEAIIRDERTDTEDNPIALDRLVVEGSHADWMPGSTGRVQIVRRIRWRDGAAERTGDFTISGTGTTLGTKTYSTTSSGEAREPLPVGIAARIFAALDREHWEGSVTLVEQECSRWGLLGKSLRLLARNGVTPLFGPSQVQSVTMDIAKGATTIAFGPSPVLSAGDLVDLLRANRNRRDSSGSIKMRSGGGVGIIGGPKGSANDGASALPDLNWTITNDVGEASQAVHFDWGTAPVLPAGTPMVTVKLREGYIIVNGQVRKVLAPMSDDYPTTT